MGNAIDAGNAVIDGDEQIRLAGWILRHEIDDRGGESVTQFETIRHKIIQPIRLCTEQAQTAHRHGACGRTIRIVIGNDTDTAPCADGIGQ